jgi:predicted transcriptional regulator YdeE
MQRRLSGIPANTDPGHIIGISWNNRPDGFRYFVGVRLPNETVAPEGTITLQIPAQQYVKL